MTKKLKIAQLSKRFEIINSAPDRVLNSVKKIAVDCLNSSSKKCSKKIHDAGLCKDEFFMSLCVGFRVLEKGFLMHFLS